jgi:hypothetical protein
VGVEPCEIPIALSGQYDNSVTQLLKLEGSGSHDIDFSVTMPDGAKMVQIEVDADASPAAQPITVIINALGTGTDPIEISPGGFMSVGSPNPTTAGIKSLRISYTADVTVRVRVLG